MSLPAMSLEEHLHEARCVIGKWTYTYEGWRWHEDCIAHVANAMMKAHYKFDESLGFTRSTYIVTSGRYAIKDYRRIQALRAKRQQQCKTLDAFYPDVINNDPIIDFDKLKELNQRLLSSGFITKQARKYLNLYYVQHLSVKEITKKLGVSKQAVNQSINTAIKNLKKFVANDKMKQEYQNCYYS